jgi:hypothetical protein
MGHLGADKHHLSADNQRQRVHLRTKFRGFVSPQRHPTCATQDQLVLQLAMVTRPSFVQAIPTSSADSLDGHEHLHPREFTVPDGPDSQFEKARLIHNLKQRREYQ